MYAKTWIRIRMIMIMRVCFDIALDDLDSVCACLIFDCNSAGGLEVQNPICEEIKSYVCQRL